MHARAHTHIHTPIRLHVIMPLLSK